MHAISLQGVDAVRMRDIASDADMSPGHILYYFGSKDALLLEVLFWSEQDLAARRRASLARTAGRDRTLRRFCEWYLPEGPRDPRWNLWVQVHAHPPDDPETLRLLLGLIQGWIDDLTAIVGNASLAERWCSLMDGLALDVVLGLPGRTRARALGVIGDVITEALEKEER
jgi:AcrR family transcriptional regulator